MLEISKILRRTAKAAKAIKAEKVAAKKIVAKEVRRLAHGLGRAIERDRF